MLDLLQHLIPDFAHMFSANPNDISAWFWSATALVFIFSFWALVVHYRRFSTRMQALHSLLEGQSKETLALSRRETLQRAGELKAPNVGMLWREFDESLVLSSDQKQLFNTLDAEHFFNPRTLAGGLTAMPDCQSGAVHSLVCGTTIYSAVAGDIGVCHADCHEEDCRKAMCDQGCSSVRSARLFSEKRDGRKLAQESAKRLGCCRTAQYGVSGARAPYV